LTVLHNFVLQYESPGVSNLV